jgi:fructose-1,6-bisphosphatase
VVRSLLLHAPWSGPYPAFNRIVGDLTLLLVSIQLGCKFVATSVRKAGLVNLTGLAGATNVQGEDVKKLDELSNNIFINALRSSGKVSVMVSEENEKEILVEGPLKGKYAVVFDPLDGSSNIDCGVSIGTIFGIYRSKEADVANVLKPGREMVAAGYCMYGSSTVFILSTGQGVNGYTLDPSIGEFILTHPNVSLLWVRRVFQASYLICFISDSYPEARQDLLGQRGQCKLLGQSMYQVLQQSQIPNRRRESPVLCSLCWLYG